MKKHYTILCLALSLWAQHSVRAQKLQSTFIESWAGSGWQNGQKNNYTYDNNNNLISFLSQVWTASTWQNFSQSMYNNDAVGNPTLTIIQSWVSATNTWDNNTRTTVTYTANKPLIMTYETWNGNTWQNWAKYTFTYDNSLNLLSQTYQTWTNGSWVNNSLYTSTNNTTGNPTLVLTQLWMSAAGTWTNSYRTTTTYTVANKPLSIINETWNGSAWQNWNKSDFTYDNNLNTLSQNYQSWMNSSWTNNTLSSYTNNANGNATLTLIQNWIDFTNSWTNTTRITSTYLDVIATGIQQFSNEAGIKAYPLPATDLLYVELGVSAEDYSITDIAGKNILTASLTKENNAIDVSGLAQGVYFLKPAKGKAIKIIKQ